MVTYRDRFEEMLTKLDDIDNLAECEKLEGCIYLIRQTIPADQCKRVSIYELMRMWGVSEHYDRMISHMVRLTGAEEDRMAVLGYDTGGFEIDLDRQKLLYFSITDNNGGHILDGGVLFQRNEMSFHT